MHRRLSRAFCGSLPGIVEVLAPLGPALIGLQLLVYAVQDDREIVAYQGLLRYASPWLWGGLFLAAAVVQWLTFLTCPPRWRQLTMRVVAVLWFLLALLFGTSSLLVPALPLCLLLGSLCAWAALRLGTETEPWTQPPSSR